MQINNSGSADIVIGQAAREDERRIRETHDASLTSRMSPTRLEVWMRLWDALKVSAITRPRSKRFHFVTHADYVGRRG